MKKRLSNFLLFILLGTLFCTAVFAQEDAAETVTPDAASIAGREPLRLSPDEAVDRAIKNNLSLESARLSSATKKRASDLSWNQFIPSVTVAGNLIMDNEKSDPTVIRQSFPAFGATGMPFEFEGITGNMYNSAGIFVSDPIDVSRWHVAGSVQVALTLSVAMFENMNRLRLDYQGGMIGYEKAKLQLERDVRKSYNNMLLLQENIKLLKENFDAAGQRLEMARANYRAGLAPELVLLQAQVAVENMKPTMDQVENGYRLSLAQFAMFLGMDYDTPFELTPVGNALPLGSETDFVSLDVKDLISKAASGKPDIQELRYSILMLQSARKAQFYSLLPFLNLSWNTTPVFIADPWKDDWGNKDLWQKSGSLTFTLGVRLHSLIPFSPDFQGVKNMDDQIRIANIGLAQLIQGTEIEIYNTVLSLDRTRITAEAQTQTVDLAERAYRLSEQAYRAGLQDLFQVRNAALELQQAKVSVLEQQFNYLNGLIDLEYAMGVPFGTLTSKENLQ